MLLLLLVLLLLVLLLLLRLLPLRLLVLLLFVLLLLLLKLRPNIKRYRSRIGADEVGETGNRQSRTTVRYARQRKHAQKPGAM